MKKKNSSVRLGKETIIELNNKKPMPKLLLYEGAALFFCVLGYIYALDKALGVEFSPLIYISAVVASVVMLFVYRLRRFKVTAVIVAITLLIGGAALYGRWVVYGLLQINEKLIMVINSKLGAMYTAVQPIMTSQDKYTTGIVMAIGLPYLLALLFGLMTVNMKRQLFLFIMIIPGILLCTVLGYTFTPVPIILLMIAVLIVYAIQTVQLGTPVGRKQTANNTGIESLVAGRCVKLILCAAVVVSAISLPIAYSEERAVGGETITNMIALFNNGDIGKLEDIMPDIIKSGGGIAGDKKLGNVSGISFKDEEHLRVWQSKPTPTYLKAFVGASYNQNRWSELSGDGLQTGKQVFDVLETHGLSAQTLGKGFAEYTQDNTWGEMPLTESVDTRIQNLRASTKYGYLPYFIQSLPTRMKGKTDMGVSGKADGRSPYEVTSYIYYDTVYGDYRVPSVNFGSMSHTFDTYSYRSNPNSVALKAYENFAHTVYRELPDGQVGKLINAAKSIYGEVIDAESRMDTGKREQMYIAANMVREWLAERCTYDLNPGRTPMGEDFAEYFVYESKKGYCSHFATAGAILLRAMGYPTRYVEGYVLTKEDIAKAQENGTDYVSIMDSNAHAWVEMYDKNLGWVPYEMTPSYSAEGVPDSNHPDVSSTPQSSQVSSEPASSEPSSEVSSVHDESSEPSSAEVSSVSNTPSNNTSSAVSNVGMADEPIDPSFYIVAIIAGGLILLIAGMIVRRRVVWIKRNQQFTQDDRQKAVLVLFKHMERVLKALNIKSESYVDVREYASEVARRYNLPQFELVTDTALKARFGQEPINEMEYQQAFLCESELRNWTKRAVSPIKGIYLRYIKVIL